ncbi:hypothetical protein AGMMS49982_20430 [Bacteroidia bacterium]|nr:hypothetical protein AGMMS49982_20430 [Bacteroidia bacterium]
MNNKNVINENRIVVEKDGTVKTIFSEETQRNGMSVEEFRRLGHERIKKLAEWLTQNGHYN